MGRKYHERPIPKGSLGSYSKIEEEYLEYTDSHAQNNMIMALQELSDMIGAIKLYNKNEYASVVDNVIKFAYFLPDLNIQLYDMVIEYDDEFCIDDAMNLFKENPSKENVIKLVCSILSEFHMTLAAMSTNSLKVMSDKTADVMDEANTPCKFCGKGELLLDENVKLYINHGNIFVNTGEFYEEKVVSIKYCPICAREL